MGSTSAINKAQSELILLRACCVVFGKVATSTGKLEDRRLSYEADMTLLDCAGARISGCWSLRSDRR